MRNGVCPLCEGTEIVVPRGMRDSGRYQFLAAVSVLVKPHSVEPVDPAGVFVPFICRRCGYTQRWQVETVNSMIKRNLGSALRARSARGREMEMILRGITHNLMLLKPDKGEG